ncbi:MAG: aspartate--tRNA ligase [Candidatus Yanofskybacteria bacterium CG10_big_fil_rev_8_21_14_0_10_36_16]|uniref:Aspartate--tRNA(Asp/Asn) ligase n=1 Tax=Candidatus Yanofskybacteria bacterium CG10_big_fil_rev_8_21_14_0_10_36_16 TaxID=1975096 RepID=A0A2J0Q8M6_9BACT|nr:MAG: aspartate--tRNA ligase [Candidatus Yanofskybacteria bacterium CG10_big_fil_rev_8_21_14_0_10_36_16]
MTRISILDTIQNIDKEVEVAGWVHTRRDHGKLIFIDLRDRSGLLQVVFTPKDEELHKKAEKLRPEWVIKIKGKMTERPEKMVNPEIETGKVELKPIELEVLSESKTPPFEIDSDGKEIGEENRMKYRYLDLRRERMRKNLQLRHKTSQFIRNWLTEKGFIEVETPIISKSTPEGARDYVVPSRVHEGKFYALPQAPQQYKQLLMVAGIEKYFQMARCFRDEDTRGDRQPEFTQMDMEMSFVEREDVMQVNEELLIEIVKNLLPDKKIQEIPFPRISYKEAMEKYNSDRPDLRKDKEDPNLLAFCWVIDFPFFSAEGGPDSGGEKKWTFTHNPFSMPNKAHTNWLLKKEKIGEILTSQYDIVLNGLEIGGGSIRSHKPEILRKVFEIIGLDADTASKNFGHMLEAFEYGAPPHGGIAWGFDRLISIFTNEPNIREVIAFTKTGDGRDLMMDAPSDLTSEQLKELHLQVSKKK